MGIKIILRDDTEARFEEVLEQLKTLGDKIVKSEADIKAAITSAVNQAKTDIANAIAKEKAEVIDAIKKLPSAGISDEALADLVAGVNSIGSSSVAAVDTISTDAAGGTPAGGGTQATP